MIHNIIDTTAGIVLGTQSCLYVNDLSAMVEWKNDDKVSNDGAAPAITVREFVKIAFAELGVEIEFSGKNEHEKGVIIDVDEDSAVALHLSTEALKFGQTVVRISSENIKPANGILETNEKLQWKPGFGFDKAIKELIEKSLRAIQIS
jgi:GDPmannose 4,6-dehydratase